MASLRPQVLILTAPVDPTADAVIQHLNSARVPLARFDAAEFPASIALCARFGAGGLQATLGGADLSALRAIYYRRPRQFIFSESIRSEHLNWCEGQARYGFWGSLESLSATWINEPDAISRAEYKPRQLELAHRAGLLTPETLITNRPAEVAEFADSLGSNGIITKALYARMPRDTSGHPSGVLYAREVARDQYSDPGITTTAHLFQEKIVAAYEVRLTVVGDDLFAAAIHRTGSSEVSLDWREDHGEVRYTRCIVPKYVAQGVKSLMSSLSLTFGALDFAVDQSGTWWFYEINPNGQWLWIEKRLELPISAALARLLEAS